MGVHPCAVCLPCPFIPCTLPRSLHPPGQDRVSCLSPALGVRVGTCLCVCVSVWPSLRPCRSGDKADATPRRPSAGCAHCTLGSAAAAGVGSGPGHCHHTGMRACRAPRVYVAPAASVQAWEGRAAPERAVGLCPPEGRPVPTVPAGREGEALGLRPRGPLSPATLQVRPEDATAHPRDVLHLQRGEHRAAARQLLCG